MVKNSKIKNPKLAKKGKVSYNWAKKHMKIIDGITTRLAPTKPLRGATLGFCLQITKETAVLLMSAQKLGARIAACAANPLTTQDDIAAFLSLQNIAVYAWSNQTSKEFLWCAHQVLQKRPDIITDDGGLLSLLAHTHPKYSCNHTQNSSSNEDDEPINKDTCRLHILGATEETTTGVTKLQALLKGSMASNVAVASTIPTTSTATPTQMTPNTPPTTLPQKILYPIISVNDAKTKYLFDNRYGTGQSTIDGYLQSANLLLATKRVVVVGYGWVGKGVSKRFRNLGSKVIVTEVNPLRALEAHMDGFDVMPIKSAATIGDIFVTCTGMTNVISRQHLKSMKTGVIVGNVGHSDVEIDTKFLLKESKCVKETLRPHIKECTLYNKHGNDIRKNNTHTNKKIFLIADGRVVNLTAAQGHPPQVMDQSFSNQLLSILYILKNHKKLPKKVIPVPKSIDEQIAREALKVMNIKID